MHWRGIVLIACLATGTLCGPGAALLGAGLNPLTVAWSDARSICLIGAGLGEFLAIFIAFGFMTPSRDVQPLVAAACTALFVTPPVASALWLLA
jgi:hypothetical protein